MRTLRNAGAGLAAALVLVAAGGDVRAAGPEAALKTAIDRLTERLEQLERRNRELEQRLSDLTKGAAPPVAVPPAAAAPALEERVKALEDIQRRRPRARWPPSGSARTSRNW